MNKIYIVGGANVDISARSFKKLIENDSNPGKVTYSFGGVAHNIAINLVKIGCPVDFITAFSEDHFGKMLYESCYYSGLKLDNCQYFADQRTSLYIAIVEPDGDMNIAIADMDILSHLDTDKLKPLLSLLDENDMLVLDTNLTVEQLDNLINSSKARIYVDPISTRKAVKITDFIDKLEMLKPNLLEAETLSGLKVNDSSDYMSLLNYFTDKGCKSIVISMGKDGLIGKKGDEAYHLSNTKVEIVNTTGAGDAFMAGYMYGQYHAYDFLTSLKYALANSAIALVSNETVNSSNSEKMLKEYYEKVERESTVTLLK